MKITIASRYHFHLLPLFATALFYLTPQAQSAVILGNYPFTSNLASTVTQPNTTISAVSVSTTTSLIISAPSSAANIAWNPSVGSARTQASAFTNGDYIEFTLTPSSGFAADLTLLTFNYGGSGGGYSANFFVRSSVDSYAANVGALASYVVPASSSNGNTPELFSVSLESLPAFQDITTPITFRLYSFIDNLTSPYSGTMRARLDNLQLQGDIVTVPEPHSLALVAVALGGWLAFSRRNRKPLQARSAA